MNRSTSLALATLLAAGVAAAPAVAQDQASIDTYETPIIGQDGSEIGLLTLRGGPNGVVGRFTIDRGEVADRKSVV